MLYKNLQFSTGLPRFYLASGSLIVAAWVLLITWQRSGHAELLSHAAIEHGSLPPLLRLAGFLLGWILMTIAMMLPGALPLLNHSIRPIRLQMGNGWTVGLTVLAYLLPWAVFGVLFYLGDNVLHHLAEQGGPLAAFSAGIAPAIVLAAGLYQLTPVKRYFAERCRSTHAIFQPDGVEKRNLAAAFRQGSQIGWFCVGSCWSLMLLMFALGHNRLEWMLVLGGVMAAERLAAWGYKLTWLVGFALVLWAAIWILV